ncbi:MAG: hypothetical protein HYW65_03935 [Candidatus Liptonbacteria bacterium]|nr:hypothetical protein [Candidatus Liptonbacteria bacterium]
MSVSEIRTCQNCSAPFDIASEDLNFYTKISVPPPTFCPECRMQRRFSWRNERTLHRNKCAKTGKPLISGFAPDPAFADSASVATSAKEAAPAGKAGYVVYDRDVWWSDDWDPLAFGIEYDFSKPFFTQFDALMRRAPQPAVFNARTTNCEYANHVGEIKNGYLLAASWGSENVAYGSRVNFCKDSQDVFGVFNCELCYELIASVKCYRTHFSHNCEACTDSFFLFDCKGCTNCVGCVNLRNKSYHILNKPYSRDEYLKKLAELKLDTVSGLAAARKEFEALKARQPHRYAALVNCQNVTGDSVYGTSNCTACFDIGGDTKDSKWIINGAKMEGVYDGYGVGVVSGLIYEAVDTGDQGERMCFDIVVWSSTNAFYSYNCIGCQNLFGCVGLRNKQNCILNRQYSKEEFENLRAKIVAHMSEVPYVDKKGRVYKYGEFFPTELSPFGYNETVAQEYFPLTKAEAEAKGFNWREPEERQYTVTKRPEELPERITDVPDSITNEVIQCANAKGSTLGDSLRSNLGGCTTAFRIIPQELQFYRRLNLPLPKLCPNCRHYARLAKRNPPKLWKRNCMCVSSNHRHGHGSCPEEFETTYSPERPEIVYCEACYQSEVA